MSTTRTFKSTLHAKLLMGLYSVPPLYVLTAKLKKWSKRESIVSPDTDIAIVGYPRSANSFATVAFRFAQPKPVKIAHHAHSAGQIMAAIYYKVPALVLIRNPKDSVVSLKIRNPATSIPAAINNYLLFYGALLGKPGYVVGRFEDVTTDFGAVITRVNERFGTSFIPFSATEENSRKVFDLIEARQKNRNQSQTVNELMIAHPTEAKKLAKPQLEEMLSTNYAEAIQEAESLWREFCAQA